MSLIYYPIIVSLFSAAFVWYVMLQIRKFPATPGVANAFPYFQKKYQAIGIVGAVIFIGLFAIGWKTALGFLLGAAFAAAAQFIGLLFFSQATSRISEASKRGLAKPLDIAFKGGVGASFSMAGLALLLVTGDYLVFHDLMSLVGLAFGAGLVAVFFAISMAPHDEGTRTAVKSISVSADFFETYILAAVSAIIVGILLYPTALQFVLLPLVMLSISLLSSLIGTFLVTPGRKYSATEAIYKGIGSSLILSVALFYPIITTLMSGTAISASRLYSCSLVGFIITIAMLVLAEYFKAKKLPKTILAFIVIAGGATASYWLAGFYGITIAAVAMTSLIGIIAAMSGYSFIIEKVTTLSVAEASSEERKNMENLSMGASVSRSMSSFHEVASASLSALALFTAFTIKTNTDWFNLETFKDWRVIVGIILGMLLPWLFLKFLKTKSFLKEIIWPMIILIAAPILVGMVFGATALTGLLLGTIIIGALTMLSRNDDSAVNQLVKTVTLISFLILAFLT